jgi:hypothetical protein
MTIYRKDRDCSADGSIARASARTTIQERQKEEEHKKQAWQDDHANPFEIAREILEQFEEEQKVPLRSGHVPGIGWVRLPFEWSAEHDCKQDHNQNDNCRHHHILDDQVRKEAAPRVP